MDSEDSGHKDEAKEEDKYEGEEEGLAETEPEVWVCSRNSKADPIDNLIHHSHHLDALRVLLIVPPFYPSSSFGAHCERSLHINDIHARFLHVSAHGAATNNPLRVLSHVDFLCSARILHGELVRQALKVKIHLRH